MTRTILGSVPTDVPEVGVAQLSLQEQMALLMNMVRESSQKIEEATKELKNVEEAFKMEIYKMLKENARAKEFVANLAEVAPTQ